MILIPDITNLKHKAKEEARWRYLPEPIDTHYDCFGQTVTLKFDSGFEACLFEDNIHAVMDEKHG